jgi:hypothetical protein
VIVNVELVAPKTRLLLNRHWNSNGGWPPAVTLKLAVLPIGTVWLAGWLVIIGFAVAITADMNQGKTTLYGVQVFIR